MEAKRILKAAGGLGLFSLPRGPGAGLPSVRDTCDPTYLNSQEVVNRRREKNRDGPHGGQCHILLTQPRSPDLYLEPHPLLGNTVPMGLPGLRSPPDGAGAPDPATGANKSPPQPVSSHPVCYRWQISKAYVSPPTVYPVSPLHVRRGPQPAVA